MGSCMDIGMESNMESIVKIRSRVAKSGKTYYFTVPVTLIKTGIIQHGKEYIIYVREVPQEA